MTTYHELTGFQRDLLTAIAGVADEPYGLALKAYLDERYPTPINHSRLYQNLDELVETGLVSRESLDERTNAYRLTDAGTQLLRDQAEALASVCDTRQAVADGGPKDILIRASADRLAGKWAETIASDAEAYWRVSGTPQQSAPGQHVWFTTDGETIFAMGELTALEQERLWFDAAHPVELPCPDEPPVRGIDYIEPLVPRLAADQADTLGEPHDRPDAVADGGDRR